MDPFTIALLASTVIGGGASLLGAYEGAQQEELTRNQNYDIAMMNRADQNRARNDQIALAERLRAESQLGGRDAEGNTSRFVPGVGWVSEYGDRPQQLLEYFYGRELPALRAQFNREDEAGRRDDDMAQMLLDQLQGLQREDPGDVENMLFEAATRGQGEAVQDATETGVRSALRRGQDPSKIIQSFAKPSMEARGNAAKDARLQARDYVDDRFNSQQSQLSALYNLFRGRSGNLQPSYNPTGQDTAPLLGQFMNTDMQGRSAVLNANAQPISPLPKKEVNDSLAKLFGATGQVISGIGERAAGIGLDQQNNELLKMYLTGGGQLDLGRGGMFGAMADRVRTSGGGF